MLSFQDSNPSTRRIRPFCPHFVSPMTALFISSMSLNSCSISCLSINCLYPFYSVKPCCRHHLANRPYDIGLRCANQPISVRKNGHILIRHIIPSNQVGRCLQTALSNRLVVGERADNLVLWLNDRLILKRFKTALLNNLLIESAAT